MLYNKHHTCTIGLHVSIRALSMDLLEYSVSDGVQYTDRFHSRNIVQAESGVLR